METKRIEIGPATTLRLQSRSGRVHVIAEPREDVEAESDRIEYRFEESGALGIRSALGGTKTLTVRCPLDMDVTVGTHSGPVRMDGKFGDVSVTTMSGGIEVQAAEEADLRSMSGGLVIGTCFGRCRMNAVSGTVAGAEVENVAAGTISGSIKFERVNGSVRAKTVSGSIDIGSCGDGTIAVKTVSGKVRIALPEGTEPATFFKTRGNVRCDFARGDDCRIEAASLSGSIEVVPA